MLVWRVRLAYAVEDRLMERSRSLPWEAFVKLRAALLCLGLLLSGCAPKMFTVEMGGQPPKDAHYVLVRSQAGGSMVVYDCISMPDGRSWNPTCVKADMRSSPPDK